MMKRRLNSRNKAKKTYIGKTGYRKFKDSGKLLHRWVAEKKIGRPLKKSEIVHHKNQNKLDNSPNNLQVLPNQGVHLKIHKRKRYIK